MAQDPNPHAGPDVLEIAREDVDYGKDTPGQLKHSGAGALRILPEYEPIIPRPYTVVGLAVAS